jgi:hypothetical protein
MSKQKIYFEYERMEPFKWPEPRDIRTQLEVRMCGKYKNCKVSKIPLSTEFVLKVIKAKTADQADKILLKYKVVNVDWEQVRELDEVFDRKMFKWVKGDGGEHGEGPDCGGYNDGGGHGGY